MYASHRVSVLHRLGSWIVLVVALIGLVGHVCVLPVEVSGAEMVPHDHAVPHDGHSGDADGVHAASCETAATVPISAGAPAAEASRRSLPLDPGLTPLVPKPRPAPAASPPLYVVHSALLI